MRDPGLSPKAVGLFEVRINIHKSCTPVSEARGQKVTGKIYMRRVKFVKSDTSHFFWEDRETQREERLSSSGQSDTKHICGCVIRDCVFAVQRL